MRAIKMSAQLGLLLLTSVAAFTGRGINSEPSTVQAQKATIQFYGVPEITIPADGWIKLTAPSGVTVHSGDLVCFDILNQMPCEVTLSSPTFTVVTQADLPAGQQFQFSISNAIDNPISVKPTTTWTMLTSTGESETNDIILTATAGEIPTEDFNLYPKSPVVGQSNILQIRARLANDVPKGGLFFIEFPKWNSENPVLSQRKTYIQGSEECTPLEVLSSDMTCDFQDDRLVIYGGAGAEIPAGSQIALEVTGFKNPIDTSIVSGFKISTQIQSGTNFFMIDQGVTTLQVKEYATLSQAKLDVRPQDSTTTDELAGVVQELNEMQLSFYLPVPLNAGCQVTV